MTENIHTLNKRLTAIEEKEPAGDESRLDRLELVVRKMAHYSGNNRILIEHGLEPWEPGQKDMRKFRG